VTLYYKADDRGKLTIKLHSTSRLKKSSQTLFNNFQDLPKSTENHAQTHGWCAFFADVPTENG